MGFKVGFVAAFSLVMLAAGCDTLDRIEDAREFADVAIDANRSRIRVLGDPILGQDPLPGTVFDAVPTSGQAVFDGAAFFAATDAGNIGTGFALVGSAEIIVDFEPGSDNVRGNLDGFQASTLNDGIVDVSGSLQLDNGVIGVTAPNAFTVDYGGTVSVDGTRYELEGDLLGRFRGTRTDPDADQSTIRALSAEGEDGSVTGDGRELVGRLTIVAEN